MSWYLTIRPDPRYSRSTATGPLVEHLRIVPGLVQTGPLEFRNGPGAPWVCIVLAMADEGGNYAIGGESPSTVNVVELVCGDRDEQWYESIAGRIASILGWEAVEEHSERTIYPAG
jgi:hypothetical protein